MKTMRGLTVALGVVLICVLLIMPCSYAENAQDNRAATVDGYSPLKKGDKGEDVMKLQTRLNELGYSVGEVDGIYGRNTEKAIVACRKYNACGNSAVADEDFLMLLYSDSVVNNLEAIPGHSIIDEAIIKTLLKHCPTVEESHILTIEEYQAEHIDEYLNTFPDHRQIQDWKIAFEYADDMAYAEISDTKNTIKLTMIGKGKLLEIAKVMNWQVELLDAVPELKRIAEGYGIRLTATVRGVEDEKMNAYMHNGEIDLMDDESLRHLRDLWSEGAEIAETFGTIGKVMNGF